MLAHVKQGGTHTTLATVSICINTSENSLELSKNNTDNHSLGSSDSILVFSFVIAKKKNNNKTRNNTNIH